MRDYIAYYGILSRESQAKILKKSKKNIDDFWRQFPDKIFGFPNGLPLNYAREISPFCPYIKLSPGSPVNYFCLWIDIQETMPREELDPILVQCIDDMVKFQLWIHGGNKENIRDIIWKKIIKAYETKRRRSSCGKKKQKSGHLTT